METDNDTHIGTWSCWAKTTGSLRRRKVAPRGSSMHGDCRGLGNLRAVPILKYLIRGNIPDVIVLYETFVLFHKN